MSRINVSGPGPGRPPRCAYDLDYLVNREFRKGEYASKCGKRQKERKRKKAPTKKTREGKGKCAKRIGGDEKCEKRKKRNCRNTTATTHNTAATTHNTAITLPQHCRNYPLPSHNTTRERGRVTITVADQPVTGQTLYRSSRCGNTLVKPQLMQGHLEKEEKAEIQKMSKARGYHARVS